MMFWEGFVIGCGKVAGWLSVFALIYFASPYLFPWLPKGHYTISIGYDPN